MPVDCTIVPVMNADVTVTRILNASREKVFRMWTEAEHLARWWGPHGMTNPVCEIDPRVDGKIRIHMAMPDGTIYPMTGVIHEIDPPARLVFTAYAENSVGAQLLESLSTVTFDDIGGKTRLTVHAVGKALVPMAAQMLGGMEMGWQQSLEKLSAAI